MDEEIRRYVEKLEKRKNNVPIWEKKCLSIEEAAAYSGMGRSKLRELAMARKCPFVLMAGNKICIVREKLDTYIEKQYRI